MKNRFAASAIVFIAAASIAVADTPAAVLSGVGTDTETSDVLLGWTFTVSSTLKVTALGYWTDGSLFTTDHDVAILNYNTGTTITSATVGNSAVDGTFRYSAASGTLDPWRSVHRGRHGHLRSVDCQSGP